MSQERDYLDYLRDIVEAMEKVQQFTQGMDYEQFVGDDKTTYAVLRAIEVIGEATKNLPDSFRERYPSVPWKRMAGMRDRVIHGYHGVDLAIVWESASKTIPALLSQVRQILKSEA